MKKISILFLTVVMLFMVTSCGVKPADNSSSENTKTAEKTEEKKDDKSSGKYKNISADTKPVGVGDIKFVNKDNGLWLDSTIYKNDGEINCCHF